MNILNFFKFCKGAARPVVPGKEVWLGTSLVLSSCYSLHALQWQACKPQSLSFLVKLGGQSNVRISFPIPHNSPTVVYRSNDNADNMSSCCLKPHVFIRGGVTLKEGFCVFHAQVGMSLILSKIQSEQKQFLQNHIWFLNFLKCFILVIEKYSVLIFCF